MGARAAVAVAVIAQIRNTRSTLASPRAGVGPRRVARVPRSEATASRACVAILEAIASDTTTDIATGSVAARPRRVPSRRRWKRDSLFFPTARPHSRTFRSRLSDTETESGVDNEPTKPNEASNDEGFGGRTFSLWQPVKNFRFSSLHSSPACPFPRIGFVMFVMPPLAKRKLSSEQS